MPIPEETIRRVREATDIVEIVSEYVTLKKRGRANYFGLSPFKDEKTPSFSVHSERQIFHDFSSGEGGNVFTFLMRVEGVTFPEAVRMLAERANIPIDEKDEKKRGETEELYRANELALKFYRYRLTDLEGDDISFAREYLERRGITGDIAEKFKIGLAPSEWGEFLGVARRRKLSDDTLIKAGLARRSEQGRVYDWFRGRLMFPIFNASGKVVAFGGRILKDDPDRPQPKYINTQETPIYHKGRLLYGIPQARDAMRQENQAILVEGYTDCIGMHLGGFTNTIAGLGTALTPEQAMLIRRFAHRVTMVYDADTAGDLAAFRGADILIGKGLEAYVALLPAGEDPDSLIREKGSEAMKEVLDSAKPLVDFKLDFFRRRGQLNTPQGRSEATRSLLETVTQIEDTITQQFVLHDVAEKLGVDEAMLHSELAASQRPAFRAKQVRVAPEEAAPKGHEEMLQSLLWVLLHKQEKRSEIFSSFHSNDLEDNAMRRLFEIVEIAHIEGEEFDEADLYDAIEGSPRLSKILSNILGNTRPFDEEQVENIVYTVPRYLTREALRREIEEVKRVQTENPSPELAQQRQELIRRVHQISDEISSSKNPSMGDFNRSDHHA
jgi:DNA primase